MLLKTVILIMVAACALIGCASTTEPTFIGKTVEIEAAELSKFWKHDISKPVMLSDRPDWLPIGEGKATYFITIDSNGQEVSKELISSTPKGWMTQKLLNKMPKQQYSVSETNPNRTPVKVKVLSEIKRMN